MNLMKSLELDYKTFDYKEMVNHVTFGIVKCAKDVHMCELLFHKPIDYGGITACDGKCRGNINVK